MAWWGEIELEEYKETELVSNLLTTMEPRMGGKEASSRKRTLTWVVVFLGTKATFKLFPKVRAEGWWVSG